MKSLSPLVVESLQHDTQKKTHKTRKRERKRKIHTRTESERKKELKRERERERDIRLESFSLLVVERFAT